MLISINVPVCHVDIDEVAVAAVAAVIGEVSEVEKNDSRTPNCSGFLGLQAFGRGTAGKAGGHLKDSSVYRARLSIAVCNPGN